MTPATDSGTERRVAIVTGAAQGIGRSIALRLAADGLDVVVNDLFTRRDQLEALAVQIMSLKRRSLAVVGDATKEADVENLIKLTVESLGGLDVMIANAGIARNSPLISTTLEEWEQVQVVNLRSAFLCYRAAAIQMIKQGRGGRIIGATSLAGKQGFPNWTSYSASKFAIRGLTQAAAGELSEHRITVNAYAPGKVNTNIWKDVAESRTKHGLAQDNMAAQLPGLEPEDVAGLVSYLVRPEAQFITGQSIGINGGAHFD